MRELFLTADQFPTLTILVTASSARAGEKWRCILPLAGQTLDNRTQDAKLMAVIAASFGGATIPEHVAARLLANAHQQEYGAEYDPRATVLGSVCFELEFGEDFAGMEEIPLTFVGVPLPTELSYDDVTPPAITTVAASITLSDLAGGEILGVFEEIPVAAGGGATAAAGERIEWELPGAVSTGYKFKKRLHGERTLLWLKVDCLGAPDTDTTLDVLKNGTSIFATAPNPVLEAGLTYLEINAFDAGADAVNDTDVFQLQIVSGTGADDMNVSMYFE